MGKNSGITLENRIIQMQEQEEKSVKSEVSKFYLDGTLPDFIPSSKQAPLAPLLAQAKTLSDPQALTQEQLAKECLSIRGNVKAGKPGNIEIQLNIGRQRFDRQILPLGNTVVKLRPMDADKPYYFFIKTGDTLDTSVFFGGESAVGVILLRDENGDDFFLRLAEFHMLSLRENPDPRKDVGLMTSYLWLTANIYSSVIFASSLNPIKNLLLSEWLQTEWQRAKDAASKPSGADGGGNHE